MAQLEIYENGKWEVVFEGHYSVDFAVTHARLHRKGYEWRVTASMMAGEFGEKINKAVFAQSKNAPADTPQVADTTENEPVAPTVAIVSEPQAKVESKFYTYYGNEVKLLGWVVVGQSAMCEYVSGNLDSREIDISYLRANEGLSEIIDYLNALKTPKINREQYIVACWYVRFLQHNTGVVDIAENYSDYYGGFMKRTWNRDTRKTYPAFIDTHIWQLALDAWQNNPTHKVMSENFPQMTVAEVLVMLTTSPNTMRADWYWKNIHNIASKLQNCSDKQKIMQMLNDNVRSSFAVADYAKRIVKHERSVTSAKVGV